MYEIIKFFNSGFLKINTILNLKGEALSTVYFVFDVRDDL